MSTEIEEYKNHQYRLNKNICHFDPFILSHRTPIDGNVYRVSRTLDEGSLALEVTTRGGTFPSIEMEGKLFYLLWSYCSRFGTGALRNKISFQSVNHMLSTLGLKITKSRALEMMKCLEGCSVRQTLWFKKKGEYLDEATYGFLRYRRISSPKQDLGIEIIIDQAFLEWNVFVNGYFALLYTEELKKITRPLALKWFHRLAAWEEERDKRLCVKKVSSRMGINISKRSDMNLFLQHEKALAHLHEKTGSLWVPCFSKNKDKKTMLQLFKVRDTTIYKKVVERKPKEREEFFLGLEKGTRKILLEESQEVGYEKQDYDPVHDRYG